jgi:hypothetical protein
MISNQHIRGNADLSEETRMFCAGAMITVGLFLAVVCVVLRGATINAQNLFALLDKIADRYDVWMNPQLLPTEAPSAVKADTSAIAILLIPHLAELSSGCAGSIASRYNELAKGQATTTAIRMPRSQSAGSLGLRIRSPPITPQFSDHTDLFSAQHKPKQDV